MSDFRVQYISGTVASGVTQHEILAPDSFLPIGSLASAFIIPATTMPTVGLGGVGGSSQIRDWALNCDINSTTRILLNRGASSGTVEFAFWLIEYVGVAGGPNEFIMRGKRIFPFNPTSTLTADSNPISGIVSLSRCVPFISGRHDGTGTAALRHFLARAEVVNSSGSNVIELNRSLGSNGDPTYVCYCVEFTGANWSVQTGTASNWTANTNKDTAITAVASLGKAWVHGYYIPGNRDTPAGGTWFAWLSSPSNLRTRTIEVSSISSMRYWVIQNSDVAFGVQVQNAVNGTNDWLSGTSPQSQTVTVTQTPSNGVFVTGWAGSNSNSTNQNPAGLWRWRQPSLTQVQAYRTNAAGDTEYVVQVISLPVDADAGVTASPAPAVLGWSNGLINGPLPLSPGRALLTVSQLGPFSQATREPGRALLTITGYQAIALSRFPGTGALSLAGLTPSLGLTKVLEIPMPALDYTETPNNAPTVTVGGGASPGVGLVTLQSLTQAVGEGGNIASRQPVNATLSLVGQIAAAGIVNAASSTASIMSGLLPEIVNTHGTVNPEVGVLSFTNNPALSSFVHIPYQWIDVDPAPVVQWT